MTSQTPSDFLTIEEVAALFGRSRESLYTERHRGSGLGALGVSVGKRLYWRRADIDDWFDRQQSPAGAA
jgi:predicted DNA-binding transcriptional regulator AlpA